MTTLSLDETRAFLASAASWSDFAASLYGSLQRYGQLTPRQQAAAESMAAKLQANTPKTRVDLGPIHAMFDTARANGLGKLAYRANGLTLWPAPANGKNPNAIYVKRSATHSYIGKVADATFYPTSACGAAEVKALITIASDPSKAAKDYGRETGQCSCCGRELTDPISIENGIGPICAAKWGL